MITLRSLTAEQLLELSRFGFDPDLLAKWRLGLQQGKLSRQHNLIQEPLVAPDPKSILDLPPPTAKLAEQCCALGRDAIRAGQLGIVVLNGGMATRFGGVVKGVVEVLGNGRSFLGLTMEDVRRAEAEHGGRIPVFLMNSFATDASTREHFEQNQFFGLPPKQIEFFTQFVSVRLQKDGDLFVGSDGKPSIYGPGHGDFAQAMAKSGCLERFLTKGGRYLFVSNVDNLGARISSLILGMHILNQAKISVEVAPKWPGDVGGSPFVVGGKMQLIEQVRYPDGFDPSIVDVFNTNTFTFQAEALRRDVPLNYYYVEKKVDGKTAIQFERLIGEMTKHLDTQFLRVQRTGPDNRFYPIKTPEDLESGKKEIAELYPSR